MEPFSSKIPTNISEKENIGTIVGNHERNYV